jgi:NDP-4-keto-2,6-dideoxyhexose 3-C-methyltransferase
MYKEVSRCRICGNTDLLPVLNLGTQALTGVFPRRIDEEIATGPLELVKCDDTAGQDTCGLLQLHHSYAGHLIYGNNYGYRSGLNQSMVDHLRNKANAIKQIVPLHSGDLILDVGSNDGTLLRAMQEPGVALIGMDPSGSKFKQYYPEQANLIPDFFSAARFRREFGSRQARVITSIAMFYDLEVPLQFMQDVYDVLADDGVWVFEQSYLPDMLRMNSYDTVCHEHLEYYALKQILWMTKRVGFKVLNVELNTVNGGSFSVTAAKSASAHVENSSALKNILDNEARCGLDSLAVYRAFSDRAFQHRDALTALLEDMANQGQSVLGYGASTKGNVMLQFCGITPQLIPAIAEVNADKFGCFTPQTLIPIISETEARASHPDVFLVLPWHFRGNIVERERAYLQSGGKLLFPLPSIELIDSANSFAHRA